ncbi:MAG TPA: hypothetical protein VH089_24815 [Streptosporangiaceae bacterium]|nr:hypothetical protein [Streptosporangiaceae bacterium]
MARQYKYRALVRLDPDAAGDHDGPLLPEPEGRVVVRARHHDTHASKMFSALVSGAGEQVVTTDHSVELTVTVRGEDVEEYLEAGDKFALWRGHDIGQGVISRRLHTWISST